MLKDQKHIWYYRSDPGAFGDKFHFQVYLGPALIGTINRNTEGPTAGTWDWHGQWSETSGERTLCNGRHSKQQAALEDLRKVFYSTLANHRRVIVQMLLLDPAIGEQADQFIKEIQP